MTVDSTNNRTDYDPDGINDTFAYDFRVDDADDLVVYADGEVVIGGYSVTGVGEVTGGDVIFDSPPAASIEVLTLIREVPLTQETAYPPLGPFPAESHEKALDKLTFIVQQHQELLSRAAIGAVDADPEIDYTLPPYEAGEFWYWDLVSKRILSTQIPSVETVEGIVVIRSIADLRNRLGQYPGETAQVLHYTNWFDGGGGPLRCWRNGEAPGTFVDNGGSIIVPIGGDGSEAWVWKNTTPSVWYVRSFGIFDANIDTDNMVRIAALIDAMQDGATIDFENVQINCKGNLTLSKPCTVTSSDAILTFPTFESNTGILAPADDTTIQNITLVGPQFALRDDTVTPIKTRAFLDLTTSKNFTIHNVTAYNWSEGFNINGVIGFDIRKNTIYDMHRTGIAGIGSKNGKVELNNITNIIGSNNSDYGIYFSTNIANDLVSENILIQRNTVDRVLNWEGIDSHAGNGIKILANTVTNCDRPIVLTDTDDYGCFDCEIAFNDIDRDIAVIGPVGTAITVAGQVNRFSTGIKVHHNNIKRYGATDLTNGSVISATYTEGVTIHDNYVFNCWGSAFNLNAQNKDFLVESNYVDTMDNDADTNALGFRVSSSPVNYGVIRNNRFTNVKNFGKLFSNYHAGNDPNLSVEISGNTGDYTSSKYVNIKYAHIYNDDYEAIEVQFPNGVAQPDVDYLGSGFIFRTANTNPAGGYTGFSNGRNLKEFSIRVDQGATVFDFTGSDLRGRSADISASAGDILKFIYDEALSVYRLVSYNR